jgi:hypothetical protein
MGEHWRITFHPDQSVEYTSQDDPNVSLKVQFEGPRNVEEQPHAVGGDGTTLVVYGTLKLKSIPAGPHGSWGIGT